MPTAVRGSAESLKGSHRMGDGGIFLTTSAHLSLINAYRKNLIWLDSIFKRAQNNFSPSTRSNKSQCVFLQPTQLKIATDKTSKRRGENRNVIFCSYYWFLKSIESFLSTSFIYIPFLNCLLLIHNLFFIVL